MSSLEILFSFLGTLSKLVIGGVKFKNVTPDDGFEVGIDVIGVCTPDLLLRLLCIGADCFILASSEDCMGCS